MRYNCINFSIPARACLMLPVSIMSTSFFNKRTSPELERIRIHLPCSQDATELRRGFNALRTRHGCVCAKLNMLPRSAHGHNGPAPASCLEYLNLRARAANKALPVESGERKTELLAVPTPLNQNLQKQSDPKHPHCISPSLSSSLRSLSRLRPVLSRRGNERRIGPSGTRHPPDLRVTRKQAVQAHRVPQAPDEHLVQQAERDVMLLSAGRFWATELADHGRQTASRAVQMAAVKLTESGCSWRSPMRPEVQFGNHWNSSRPSH